MATASTRKVHSTFLKQYNLKLDISWMTKGNENLNASEMRYTLTSYTPTVSAEVHCFIHEDYIKEFEKVGKLDVENRSITVQVLPELKRHDDNYTMFNGPWKFVVLKYIIDKRLIEHNKVFQHENSGNIYSEGKYYLVRMICVDKNFIKLRANEDWMAFRDKKVSDAVKGVISKLGLSCEVSGTKSEFDWFQSAETSLNFIQRLLPYAVSESKGELGYLFYCYNEKCYFKSVEESKAFPIKLTISSNNIESSGFESTINNEMIEKYGSLDNFTIMDHGIHNFKRDKPKKMTGQAFNQGGKQHKGKNRKQITISVDKKEFKEFFASNVRKRIYQCSRLIKLKVDLDTNITPLSILNIQNIDSNKKENVMDGDYYVIAVQHRIGLSAVYPFHPSTYLVLGTEVDINGQESPEGTPLGNNSVGSGSSNLVQHSGTNASIGGITGINIREGTSIAATATRAITGNVNSIVENQLKTMEQTISNISKGIGTNITDNVKNLINEIPKKIIDNINGIATEVVNRSPLYVGNPIKTSIVTLENNLKNLESNVNEVFNEVIYNTVGKPLGRFSGELNNLGQMIGTMYNDAFEPIRKYTKELIDYIPGGSHVFYDTNDRNWYEQLTNEWIVRPFGSQIPFQDFIDEYKGPKELIYMNQLTPEEVQIYQNSYGYDVPIRFLREVEPIVKENVETVKYTINDIIYDVESLGLQLNNNGIIVDQNLEELSDYSNILNEDDKIVKSLGSENISKMISMWNTEVYKINKEHGNSIIAILMGN